MTSALKLATRSTHTAPLRIRPRWSRAAARARDRRRAGGTVLEVSVRRLTVAHSLAVVSPSRLRGLPRDRLRRVAVSWIGVAVLFAVALASYGIESVAWPLAD